jgi:hypothetical protein
MEWGESKRGLRENERNRLRVLGIECRGEMKMAWVEK